MKKLLFLAVVCSFFAACSKQEDMSSAPATPPASTNAPAAPAK